MPGREVGGERSRQHWLGAHPWASCLVPGHGKSIGLPAPPPLAPHLAPVLQLGGETAQTWLEPVGWACVISSLSSLPGLGFGNKQIRELATLSGLFHKRETVA